MCLRSLRQAAISEIAYDVTNRKLGRLGDLPQGWTPARHSGSALEFSQLIPSESDAGERSRFNWAGEDWTNDLRVQ